MLTIQQMIDNVLANTEEQAKAKLAQEAKDKGGKTKEEVERQADKEESQQGGGHPEGYPEKTASEYVDKLASAVEEVVSTLFPKVAVASEASGSIGSGKGPGASQTNVESPTPGTQPEGSGEAKTKIPLTPPMESKGSGGNEKAPANAMATNAEMMHPPQPAAGVLKQSSLQAYMAGLKTAEDKINPAQISAPKSTTLPEDVPSEMKRPAEVTSQERHLQNNEAPVSLKKVDAKAAPKKRMGEVLDEPAQTAATDKVLDNALGADKVDQAGAKIAAAKAWATKIASEGCSCDSETEGSCSFCKLAEVVNKKKGSEKTSQAQPVGAGSAVPSTVQPSPRGGATAGGAPTPQM